MGGVALAILMGCACGKVVDRAAGTPVGDAGTPVGDAGNEPREGSPSTEKDARSSPARDARADSSIEGGGEVCRFRDDPSVGHEGSRTCSPDPLTWVWWEEEEKGSCTPRPGGETCLLSWGCEPLEAARAAAAASCGDAGWWAPFQAKGAGLVVLQAVAKPLVRAFYDGDSGELVGIWEEDYVGQQRCSGTVPTNQSYADDLLRDIESLCDPADGGSDPDGG